MKRKKMLDPTTSSNHESYLEDLREINVIPLVDVMLVLLVIFMVTAPLTVGGLAVKLPTSSVSSKSLRTVPLVITIRKDGDYFIEKEAINEKDLAAKLDSIMAFRGTKGVYIRADQRVMHGKVVHALSAARAAGAANIKILTKVTQAKK